jgi:saccharopine dehydrogenase-like NADP-dependent oxidoreductase
MLLKTHKRIRNEAKEYLKTKQLDAEEGEKAKKYLKTNDIVYLRAAGYARFACQLAQNRA